MYTDSDSIGDWDGQEDLAAENLDRIYDFLQNKINELDIDCDYADNLRHRVFDLWGSEPDLLTITDDQIIVFVEGLF